MKTKIDNMVTIRRWMRKESIKQFGEYKVRRRNYSLYRN